MKDSLKITLTILVVIASIGCVGMGYSLLNKDSKEDTKIKYSSAITASDEFNFNLLKEVNKVNDSNYLVSPLSVAYALSILKDGANGNTKLEIDNVLSGYEVKGSINIPNTIGIANVLFIKNKYKSELNKNYTNDIQNNYDAEVLFDDFNSPDVINNWVNNNTYQMIPKVIEKIDQDFVLGIVNAIAIDIEWKDKFECDKTRKETFIKSDGSEIDTVMMYEIGNNYIENDKAKGIIKDYAIYDKLTGKKVSEENKNTISLEYVAILPNDDLKTYIESFNQEELNSLMNNKKESNDKFEVQLSIPRYNYDYNLDEFKDILKVMGIKDAFTSNANFKAMYNSINQYVSETIHKTHIELSENGTKASAVTAIMMNESTVLTDDKKIVEMKFNKPFLYFIKEKNTNNIWFMGAVYEPAMWNEETITCSK